MKRGLLSTLGWMLRPIQRELPLDIRSVRSVLILRHDALGDAILATPVWRALKAANPAIHIGVAGSLRNIAFLKLDEDIDETVTLSRSIFRSLRELRNARRTKWDVVINLFFHDKTRGALFARLAAPGAVSVTMVRDPVKDAAVALLYTRAGIRPKELTPMVTQNCMALEQAITLGSAIKDIVPTLPRRLRGFTDSNIPTGKYIILHVEASQDYKEWGLPNSGELTKRILERYPSINIYWTSSEVRAEEARVALRTIHSPRASYLATPSLEELCAAVRGAAAVVSPDTSVIHIAVAQQVPLVGLFMEPNEFLPFTALARVLFASNGKKASAISVDAVLEALKEYLPAQIEA